MKFAFIMLVLSYKYDNIMVTVSELNNVRWRDK